MSGERTLSHEQARRFYDRLGAGQDSQVFYEEPALRDLVRHAELDRARAVLEFGSGTGRFAVEILAEKLPETARYLGIDQSETMVRLARERLRPFAARAEVRLSDGSPELDVPDAAFDRFLSSYVLDLLSVEDVAAVLAEAHRVLEPGGLLGLVGLTPGASPLSRLTTFLWRSVHRLNPMWVGGCRPLEMRRFLDAERWSLRHRSLHVPFGIASEVVIAQRR